MGDQTPPGKMPGGLDTGMLRRAVDAAFAFPDGIG